MSKKDFSGGLSSLLGEQPKKAKAGRPVTQTKEITKSSQEGTKEHETRATFIVREELLENIKNIAYWERKQIKEVIHTALQEAVDKYVKHQGQILPRPDNIKK